MLPADTEAVRRGLNFLTPGVASYAEERIQGVRRAAGTLDADRLRRNMLSSMPLCFNLFGFLRLHRDLAAQVLGQVLNLDIARLDDGDGIAGIEVEWAPPRARHLGDRTAFDAVVAYRTGDGRRGFLGVETKYTEPFGRPSIVGQGRRLCSQDHDRGGVQAWRRLAAQP